MLVLKNIVKEDEKERGRKILDHLDFYLNDAEYVETIAGEELAGDLLVRILALIDKGYEGEYVFNGTAVNKLDDRESRCFRMKNIGLAIGKLEMIDELTIEENLKLPFLYQKNHAPDRSSVQEALQKFNLAHRKHQYPASLSPVIKLKTTVAQSIILKPKALVLQYNVESLSFEDHLELTNLLFALTEEGLAVASVINKEPPSSLAHRKLYLHNGKILSSSF